MIDGMVEYLRVGIELFKLTNIFFVLTFILIAPLARETLTVNL